MRHLMLFMVFNLNFLRKFLNGQIMRFFSFLDDLSTNTNFTMIKCNNNWNGYYLINYSEKLAKNFGTALKRVSSEVDRAFSIYNSYLLAFAGSSTYKIPAFFTEYLFQDESSHLPFSAFIFHMLKIADILENKNQYFEFYVNSFLLD